MHYSTRYFVHIRFARRFLQLSEIVVCIALATPARGETTKGPPAPPNAPFTRVLSNGLRVIASADHRAPMVAIDIRYGVGDAMDPPEFPGLAQRVGQLIVAGSSSHVPSGEAERIALSANLPIQHDVRVTADETHVTAIAPATGLELALWLEAEHMGFVTDAAEGVLAAGQGAFGSLEDIPQRAVFGTNHPYFLETADRAPWTLSHALATERLHDWYTPANATIAVTGDLDPASVGALVEKYFGGFGGHSPSSLPDAPASPWTHEVEVAASVDSPMLEVAWATPAYLTPDNLPLDVAARLLELGLRSRLVDKGRANQVSVMQRSMRLASVFTMRADLSDVRDRSLVFDAFGEELEKIRSGKVGETDLALAKRLQLLDVAVSRDSLVARTRSETEAFAITGQPGYSAELFRRYGAIDASAVTAAVSRNLGEGGRVVARVEPNTLAPRFGVVKNEPRRAFRAPGPARARAPQDSSLWYHPPGVATPPASAVNRATESQSAMGVRVLVMAREELRLVRFRVFAPWSSPLPSLETFRALPQALAIMRIDGETLASRLASLGVKATFAGDVVGLSVAVTSTPDAVGGSLRLILEALRRPLVRKDSAKELRERLAQLSTDHSAAPRPTWPLARATYDAAGQWTWPALDVPSTIPFNQKELDRLVRTAWKRDFTVSFVGAISPEEAVRSVDAADRGGPRSVGAEAQSVSRSNRTAPKYDFVQDERSNEASLVFSCVIPDSIASPSATAALPAFFAYQFIQFLTEAQNPQHHDAGVSVDSGSTRVVRLPGATLFYLDFAVRAEESEKTLRSVLDVAAGLERGGVSWSMRRGIGRSLFSWLLYGFDSTEDQLERLYELGPAFDTSYSTFQSALEVDVDDVRSAVHHCFAPDSLRIVGYGNVRDAAAKLEARGYAPIRVAIAENGGAK
jgi:predicted Zn-dependent peptidase